MLTAEEFMQLEDVEAPVELVRGVVSDLPFPFPRHGQVCAKIGFTLASHVENGSLGFVLSNHTCIINMPMIPFVFRPANLHSANSVGNCLKGYINMLSEETNAYAYSPDCNGKYGVRNERGLAVKSG